MTLRLADAPALGGPARRTSAVRLALAAALVGCLVAAFAVSGGSRTPSAAAAASGADVEIVLDLSGSVAEVSNPQILRALRSIAGTARRVGLVAFSDSAEEVLPPETPPAELRKLLPYFEPIHGQVYGPTPWSLRFTGGTAISSGLALARQALERDRAGGSIVLISDAADNVADTRALRRELVALAQAGFGFHLDRLRGSTPGDVAVYRRVYGKEAVSVVPEKVPTGEPASQRSGAAFPRWLVAFALIAAALAAIRELVAVSLSWRSA